VGLTGPGTLLLAASHRKIEVLDLAMSTLLWIIAAPDVLLDVGFNGAGPIFMVTTRTGLMLSLQGKDGITADEVQFSDMFDNDRVEADHKQRPAKLASTYRRPPILTVFSMQLDLLAVGHRARPVPLWDLGDISHIGQLWRTSGEYKFAVIALASNRNPDISLFAAAHRDGSILAFDPWTKYKM